MSNGASGLEVLAQERDNLLIAEVAGLLHNIGKLHDGFFVATTRTLPGETKPSYPGYQFKRIAQPSASLLKQAQTEITALSGNQRRQALLTGPFWSNQELAEVQVLQSNFTKTPSEPLLRSLVRDKIIAAETLSKFYQGQGPLDSQQENGLRSLRIVFDSEEWALADLLSLFWDHFHHLPATEKYERQEALGHWIIQSTKLPRLLALAHGVISGAEKKGPPGVDDVLVEPPETGQKQQFYGHEYIATAFGYESSQVDHDNLDRDRNDLFTCAVSLLQSDRQTVLRKLEDILLRGLGDTQWPINDVSLWDYSFGIAALFKAAVAKSLIEGHWAETKNTYWQLLRISLSGLPFLQRSPSISDLLGRRSAMHSALDQARELLEVTYPLGNEIYRDENGSAFVVPALDGDDSRGTKLLGLVETFIRDAFRQSQLQGELVPALSVSEPSREAAKLHQLLEEPPPPPSAFIDSVRCWWQGEPADICTACGVRPQGWSAPTAKLKKKAQQRNVCHICLERRGERAKEWAQARHGQTDEERKPWQRTIWLDEVADDNGRLALVVGRFDLSQWLNGEMVQTMLVACDPTQGTFVPKNPSFARIQRVWRTTHQFWREVQGKDIPSVVGLHQYRLSIGIANVRNLRDALGRYHVYEAEIDGRRLSVVWDSETGHLLTADNLAAWTGTKDGTKALHDMLRSVAEVPLFEPGGYGQQRSPVATARVDIDKTAVVNLPYSPTITLLTEPQIFMTLVPATAALSVVSRINERYELEMSKVRNRLPLFLGLVFFDRRQPLFSALDAGRRMLKRPLHDAEYTVVSSQPKTDHSDDIPPHLRHPHFKQWQELTLKAPNNECVTWHISTVMGDGSTEDKWYPYYQVVLDAGGNAPSNRGCHFKRVTAEQQKPDGSSENVVETMAGNSPEPPDTKSVHHWIHVSELMGGDRIKLTPARFAYLYLDTSARRFEAGQKEPWLLEQLGEMVWLWGNLKELARDGKLTDTKLRAIEALFKAKGESWRLDEHPTESAPEAVKADYQQRRQAFENLVKSTLDQEGLSSVIRPDQVLNGLFAATLELYVRIIKDRLAP
jgi:hypothetical protein